MTTYAPERTLSTLSWLRWRTLRGPSDYRTLANIARRCNLADHVDEVPTVESIASEMEHPVNFDPAVDVLIAEIEGRPVAWQQTAWRVEDGHYAYALKGFVSPGWRRRGIGRELLRRGERRLRQVAAGHPVNAVRYFRNSSPASRTGKLALLQAEGYHPVRHFYSMLRLDLTDLPEAGLPAGLELCSVRPEHWRAIWEAKEEAFRDHWGAYERTNDDFERWLETPDVDPSLWRVAWDADSNQIAGVSITIIHEAANAVHMRLRGEVAELSVRRPWRKRGLGRALLIASLRALRERGQTEASIGVDSENPSGALRLYESAGFQIIEHAMVFNKAFEREP